MIYKDVGVYNGAGVYNSAGVYNGAGVYKDGVENIVNFGGIDYGYVKIGSLLWTTENLKNYTPGALYFKNSEEYKDLGYLYPTITIIQDTNQQSDFINSILHSGWRIPTKEDFETLLSIPIEELKTENWPTPGNNASKLNIYPTGYRGWGGGWVDDNVVLISSTAQYGGDEYFFDLNDISFSVNYNDLALSNEGQRLRAVRLCCNA